MNLKIYLLRLVAILTAFMLGVGVFNAAQYLQSFSRTTETATIQPVVKQETLFVPSRVVPSPLVEPTPGTVNDSEEMTKHEYSGEGDYYIVGDLPKEFKDFDSLTIITTDYAKEQSPESYDIQIPPEGYIETSKKFNFTRINIGNRQIAFETETKKGISYKFAGEFTDGEMIEYKAADGYEVHEYSTLKGRLVKMRNGKKVAEIKVNFAAGGC